MLARLTTGTVIDKRYIIIGLLGQGRSGTVYSARDQQLARDVAIKLINLELVQDNNFITRFVREARTLANIDHKNILRCFDLVLNSEIGSYLVTELVPGISLSQILNRQGRINVGDALDIVIQICDGADILRAKDLVHRDIKPSNIIIDTSTAAKSVKIIDFGLVGYGQLMERSEEFKITKPDVVFGAPAFMSPEQIRGLALDHRSDIYSIGCVLFRLICGENSVIADSALETMVLQLTRKPKPLSAFFDIPEIIPEGLDDVVQMALEKSAELRYQKASELKFALSEIRDKITIRESSTTSKCRICGRASLEKTATASITGWIFSCSCGQANPQLPELKHCHSCGKIVDERPAGSLTQWMFLSSRCSCDRVREFPEANLHQAFSSKMPSTEQADSKSTFGTIVTIGDVDSSGTQHDEMLSAVRTADSSAVSSTFGSAKASKVKSKIHASLFPGLTVIIAVAAVASFFCHVVLRHGQKKTQLVPSQTMRAGVSHLKIVNELMDKYEKLPVQLSMTADGQWTAQVWEATDSDLAELKIQIESYPPLVQARKQNKIVTGIVKVKHAIVSEAGLSLLKYLHVRLIDLSNSTVTDQDIECLKDFPFLDTLVIRNADRLSSNVVDSLSKIRSLTTLRIFGHAITTDVLKESVRLSRLKELEVGELFIVGADIEALSRNKQLQTVGFEACTLDASAYTSLSAWRNLKGLRLSKMKLTKSDVAGILLLENLQTLEITRCSGLEPTDVSFLRRKLLRTELTVSDGKSL